MTLKELRYDNLYMDLAARVAEMSYATRARVGCVIVKGNQILSTGFNGMPSGMDNCCEHVVEGQLTHTTATNPEVSHAEENAIAKIARSTQSSEGATAYVTLEPCLSCAKLMYSSGISRVVYRSSYKCHAGTEFLIARNIQTDQLTI